MKLTGAVGILTGASRGIGVVLAEHLARSGVRLALAARSAEDLEATAARVKELGAEAIVVPTDVTKKADLKRLVARATKELGPVDLLVNNAGIEHYARYETLDLSVIDAILQTNVAAAQILARLVLPEMVERRHGHVVNVASLAGKVGLPYNTAYSSSKHALVGFSSALREEMRPYGVGVSVICPTFVSDTGMHDAWSRGKKQPMVARTVSPEEVARATIRAIERNRGEVIVAKGLGKAVDVLLAIAPEFTARVERRLGLYRYVEQEADRVAQHNS